MKDRILTITVFQSTRPRGARLEKYHYRFGSFQVSIHAPTRGATRHQLPNPCRRGGFNPRAHAGRDDSGFGFSGKYAVSIHAPTRGATLVMLQVVFLEVFQSTRPRGARRF